MREKNEYGQIRPDRPHAGSGSRTCFPAGEARRAGRRRTTASFWKRFSGAPGPVRRGGTCRRNSATGTACSSDSGDGRGRAFSTVFSRSYRKTSTSNTSALTAPSFRRTRRRRAEKGGRFAGDRAIQGGLTTKIVALVDALGYLVCFELLPGQAHDLAGTPPLLEGVDFGALIGDKAFDADSYVQKQG